MEGPLGRERIDCLVVCYTANMVSVGVADGGGTQMERQRGGFVQKLVLSCLVQAVACEDARRVLFRFWGRLCGQFACQGAKRLSC